MRTRALNASVCRSASLGRILDHNLGAIVSLLDLDARLHYVNARFAKSFNMTPAEMIGESLFDLYTRNIPNAFMPFIRRAFAGEEVYYERLGPVVGSAGIWHTIAVTPWRDDTGRIIGAATSSMRVHELKVKVGSAARRQRAAVFALRQQPADGASSLMARCTSRAARHRSRSLLRHGAGAAVWPLAAAVLVTTARYATAG